MSSDFTLRSMQLGDKPTCGTPSAIQMAPASVALQVPSTAGRLSVYSEKKSRPQVEYDLGHPALQKRDWSAEEIDEAIFGGVQVRAINQATGNPATRYVHPITGKSVVIDDVTEEVIHLGGPGFQYGPGSGDI